MKRSLLYLVLFLAVAQLAQAQGRRIPFVPYVVVIAPTDGVADAGPQIQAAIDRAPAFSEVILPKGTYAIGTAGISLSSKSNLTIRGFGAKLKATGVSALNTGGTGASMILLDACTNIKITGLEIDNDEIAHNPIALHDSTECEISHCKIYDGNATAHIFSLNGTRNRYLYNRINGGAGTTRGMWIGNSNSDLEDDCLIQGNHVRDAPASAITGHFNGGTISENYAIGSSGSGINFGAGAGSPENTRQLIIALNHCLGNAFHGIQSDGTAPVYNQQVDISTNFCGENDGSGIFVTLLRDSVIKGNICWDNNADASGSGNGITCAVGKGLTFIGNRCYDTRTGGSRTQTNGIGMAAAAAALDIENISITGNACPNNLTSGIAITNSGSGTIAGVAVEINYCVDNGTNGVFITDAVVGDLTEFTVIGNHCMGNGTTDLRIDPPDAVISGNRYTTSIGLEHTFTDQDTTPSVKSRREFVAANTAATVITNFDDGVINQVIEIRATNGNTTINNTANTLLTGAANQTLTANSTISFRKISATVWIETARSIK